MKTLLLLCAATFLCLFSCASFAERGGAYVGTYHDNDQGYRDNNQNSQNNNQEWNHDNNQNNQNNQNWNHPTTGSYVVYGAYGNAFFYQGLYFPSDTPDGFAQCTQVNSMSYCENYYSYYPYPPASQ